MIKQLSQNKYYPQLLVLLQFGLIALMLLFSHAFLSSIYGLIIFSLGVLLGIWALTHNQRGNFHIQPKLKENSTLITTGIYSYIRHPMYSSVILMMLGVLISTPSISEWIFFILLITVLVLKAKREESLWMVHDKAYVAYQQETKLFVPYIL